MAFPKKTSRFRFWRGGGATEDHVREVLDTGLFTSRGGELMGWAHQSFAEFLAARYLVEKKVSPENVLKILLHPSGGLVPQLGVVAAWIESLSKQIRDVLIASEPLVLLRGDLIGWGGSDLAALTTSLLTGFKHQTLRDFIPVPTTDGRVWRRSSATFDPADLL
ncbi:hypothetical protein IVA79_10525 [Bradyrhizobium sp. 138]|uniref:hypothetical protein n=1 Tax=Bradyrhizobium sp. 138 TaxID=2782615 RepID=UPI001FFBEB1C|nr:hypothetical protein [Bradyrhizobium sp. 138]MCK1734375.1 hypothetical protein [Bradyrhizobium sp. 138]